MTDSDPAKNIGSEFAHIDDSGSGAVPLSDQTDSAFNDLWNVEDRVNLGTSEGSGMSETLKFELETLTLERERLKKEKWKLTEMLESIKLEEEIALMKSEVSALDDENRQLLAEIQRRKSTVSQITPG